MTTKSLTRADLDARYPEAAIIHGWGMNSHVGTRWGWWAQSPAGFQQWLGATLAKIKRDTWTEEDELALAEQYAS